MRGTIGRRGEDELALAAVERLLIGPIVYRALDSEQLDNAPGSGITQALLRAFAWRPTSGPGGRQPC